MAWGAAAWLAAIPTPAAAADGDAERGASDPTRDWLDGSHLTGDWGGLRGRLHGWGIDPYASYVAGFFANVHGGFATGVRYEGYADWGVDTDLARLVHWPGGHFHIGWYSYHGGQASQELVGPFATTYLSSYEADPAIRFYEIFVRQEWFEGDLELKVGQLAADADFFVVSEADALLNATFGYLALGRSQQIGPFYPLAAPGAYAAIAPGEHWSLKVGVYTADVGSPDAGNIGFDWGFDDGVVVLAEGAALRRPFGRRGRYALGVFGTTATGFDFSSNGDPVTGGVGVYASIDQSLVSDRKGRDRLGAFLRTQVVPYEDRNEVQWYLDGGLKWTGPFASRPDDVASLGVAYLRFARDYVAFERGNGNDVSAQQLSLELTYRAQLTSWLSLQPDLQLFLDPHLSRRNAVSLGLLATFEL